MAKRRSDNLIEIKRKNGNYRFTKDDILYKIHSFNLYTKETTSLIFPNPELLDMIEESTKDNSREHDYYIVSSITKGDPDVALCKIYLNAEQHHLRLIEKDSIISKNLLDFELEDKYEFMIDGTTYPFSLNYRIVKTPLGEELENLEIYIESWELEKLLKHYKLIKRDDNSN